MLANKRSSGAVTRSSVENKKTCFAAGETAESLISGDLWDSKQGVWSELSEEDALSLSKSVVSLALCDGHTVLFASSGIAIECHVHGSRFLTSASLIRALKREAKGHDNVEIKVCHKGRTVTGFLEEYDLDYDIAVVKITSFLDVQKVLLHRALNLQLHSEVVAVGHAFSGEIMAMSGELTCDPMGFEDGESPMFSTCKLSEAWVGGPLFDFFGRFVGMNLFTCMGTSCFLPKNIIIARLEHFQTSQQRNIFLARIKDLKAISILLGGERPSHDTPHAHGDALIKLEHELYEMLGYPRPSKRGMILVNSFEQYFGDVYRDNVREGIWKLLKNQVSEEISRSVVSLASFNGNKRYFACTGFFIDWDDECQDIILTSASLVRSDPLDGENKIIDGLKIEVKHPKGPYIEGTLIHYNLHYNVALVSVKKCSDGSFSIHKHFKKYSDGSFSICQQELINRSSEVVAVGRCFKSGELMASSGKLVGWSGFLDCKSLLYCTCKTTKIVIGGPLVDLAGNFIGMNFYDRKLGTPALYCGDIVRILEGFKEKRISAEADNFSNPKGVKRGVHGGGSVHLNWWPVPQPYWRHEEEHGDSYLSEFEQQVVASNHSYEYVGGHVRIHM